MATGKKLSDAYIELHADDSKLTGDVKVKATKVGREFGGQLNRQLRALSIDPLDMKANPAAAIAAIGATRQRLEALRDDAENVEVRVKTSRALIQLNRLGKQVGEVGDTPVEVQADTSPARREADRLVERLRVLEVEPIDLDANPAQALAQIERVQAQLREVARNTTVARVRIDAESTQGDLNRLRQRIGDVGGDSATGFAGRFGARLAPLLAKLPISGSMATGIGAAAAMAAPILGATIAAAIIGGAGIGGITGGFLVAAGDARVTAATDRLGDRLEARLQRAAGVFIQPTLDRIADIQQALDTIDVEQIFRDSARYAPMLTEGVSSAITDLGDGIESLIANAGPVIDVISRGIAGIGEHLGDGLELLSDNGPEAAAALATVFGVINSGIDATFILINALTEVYGWFQKISGDTGLQLFLKLVGADIDKTGFSARRTAEGTGEMSAGFQKAAQDAEKLKEQQALVKAANDAVTASQDALQESLDSLGGRTTIAGRNAEALKTAMDNLYGAAIRQTDANEGYQASWDSLSESVKANGRSLDIHTQAGRTNRDALQDLLTKSGELYLADIAAGKSVEYATGKHRARTEQVRKEAEKVGFNKKETDKLIGTYNNIPPKKATNLILDGVKGVANALDKLYRLQRALALGQNIDMVQGTATWADIKRADRKAAGGPITGGGLKGVDSVHIVAAPGEFMHRTAAVDYYGLSAMEDINARRIPKDRLTGYAAGGLIAPVDTSRRWPFRVDVGDSYVMSRAQAMAKVIPAGPSGAATGAWMKQMLERMFHVGMISGPRPGARTLGGGRSYHGWVPYRAVDFPALLTMARYMYQNYKGRLKEAITPWQQYNVLNGRDHAYSGDVYAQHAGTGRFRGNRHNHFAMDNGGYLMPGWNPPIYNGTGRPEPVTPAREIDELADLLRAVLAAIRTIGPDVAYALTGAMHTTRMVGRST